jgi:hypothetical protein
LVARDGATGQIIWHCPVKSKNAWIVAVIDEMLFVRDGGVLLAFVSEAPCKV